MNLEQLYSLVEEFYDYKIRMLYKNAATNVVVGILYDSFFLECSIDVQMNKFDAGICFNDSKYVIRDFLGKKCLLECDEDSIKKSLLIIDDYCRLRLPDKFLKEYALIYAWDNIEVMKKLGVKKFDER